MKDLSDLTRGWLTKAASDLSAMRGIMAGEGPFDTACFHAQQAVEKTLKTFLAYHDQPIPRIHQLENLQDACLSIALMPLLAKIEVAQLTKYAVEMRYDFTFWPERSEALSAFETSVPAYTLVLAQLPNECHP